MDQDQPNERAGYARVGCWPPPLPHHHHRADYDTCYGTTGITMTAADRAAHLDAVRGGAPFGAAVHSGLSPAGVGGALNDYVRLCCVCPVSVSVL